MIDHITFGVTDFVRSIAFYATAFAPFGVTPMFTVPEEHTGGATVMGFGNDRRWFWLIYDAGTRVPLHLALAAQTRA
jgi:catechol 2,3-dioxygenase-like lactoylglutathione lyase family enzyme